MPLPTRRPTTTLCVTVSALALALGLAACSELVAEDEPPSGGTASNGPQPDTDGRLTRANIYQDRERFGALGDRMRQEFSAFAAAEGPSPVVYGLHVCSVLYADHGHDRDVQQRYEELRDEFSGDGFISSGTGEHWVDVSIQELCPDLKPQVAR